MAKVHSTTGNMKSLFLRFEFIYLCACLVSSPPQDQLNPDIKYISQRILDDNSLMQTLTCKKYINIINTEKPTFKKS